MLNKQYFLYSEGGGFANTITADWPDALYDQKIKEIISQLPQDLDLGTEAIVVDLFCGTGGTSWGFEQCKQLGKKKIKVIYCVNHDKIAIESHLLNHPQAIHAIEDIRILDLRVMIAVVEHYRRICPNAKLILWGSIECTNFSKAKGGLSRDPDSRTLANHLFRYVQAINPDYIMIENVVEFMAWGPVRIKAKKHIRENLKLGVYAQTELKMGIDKKTGNECYWWTPVSHLNGSYWMKWREEMKSYGYRDDWRRLNAADYGVPQTRDRLFGVFAKPGLPIVWPNATHSKVASSDLFGQLEPWIGVKEVLDLNNIGESIFNRDLNENLRKQDRKPLVTKTIKRYYEGCIKIIAGGKKRYEEIKAGRIKPECMPFIAHYYGNGGQFRSINDPNGCVPCNDRFSLVNPKQFINENYSASTGKTIFQPSGSILAIPKQQLMTLFPLIINTSFSNNGSSVFAPSPTVLANRKHHYVLNPSHGGHCTSIERPSPVVIARQDKAPLYLLTAVEGNFRIPVYEGDCEWTIKLKEFMAVMGFSNVFMRMFDIPELLAIQSFPKDHQMKGSKSDQKKFIGNAVAPKVVTALGMSYIQEWTDLRTAA